MTVWRRKVNSNLRGPHPTNLRGFVLLHAGKDIFLSHDTKQALESRLNPQKFFQIHCSAIVNLGLVSVLRLIW
jgi:hypothetical protein